MSAVVALVPHSSGDVVALRFPSADSARAWESLHWNAVRIESLIPIATRSEVLADARKSTGSGRWWVMLTENQRGVLVSMYTGEWMRPMDMGGRDGSHHSATLAALVRKGLVERKVRWRGVRGSYLYRITEAGSAANQQVRCRCDGGSYEVRERPLLVHPKCPVHASNQQVPGGAS